MIKSCSIFIMAGGSGERFWPLSRTRTPKHLLRLLGKRTLLEETLRRVHGLVPPESIYILTNSAQLSATRRIIKSIPSKNILAEPAKRDTAPAAALATAISRGAGPDSVCVLLPADAVIHNTRRFRSQLSDAIEVAQKSDALVTLGITPHFAATGYGYLELGDELSRASRGSSVLRVKRFVEKPDAVKAARYFKSGRYFWNAGMFAWKSEVFLAECERLAPELAEFIERFPAKNYQSYFLEKFPKLPKISVDYAIMEKAAKVVAVEAGFDWDDAGAWTSLPNHMSKDADGNTVRGACALRGSRNNIVIAAGSRTVALCGVSDLVVVETEDAVLVCHRDAVQEVKALLPSLPKKLL